MPTITKQLVQSNALQSKRSNNGEQGSVLSEAIPVADLRYDYVKMLVYGQNRVGKTTLACQFPKPLLLVSFEPSQSGGAKSVKNIPGIMFLHVRTTDQAERLAVELAGDNKFKTHVLDGGSNWERMHMADVLGIDADTLTEQIGRSAHGGITRDQYTDRTERLKNQVRKFLSLPANTVLLCREKDHQPPKDQYKPKMMRGFEPESFFASDLSGGAVGWMHDAFDYIGRLYVEEKTRLVVTKRTVNGKVQTSTSEVGTGKNVHRLRTVYHPNYAAGFRSSNPEAVPEFIEAGSPQEMYEKIVKVIAGEKVQ